MPVLQVSGSIPTTIRENAKPGDWVAGLTLAGDTSGLVGIELTGANALAFSAQWNAALGLATLGVAAPVDFEAFAVARIPSQLSFALRFVFADGSRYAPSTTYRVAVTDVDDTPPTALRFLSGGSVTAGAIGSTIGILSITDPDSAGPFLFSFAEEDAWRFEVVGNVLKLKDGISLGLDEMPNHPLFIEVSDGHQSAGFTLNITVNDPGAQQSVVTVVSAEQPQSGIALSSPVQAVSLHEARDLTGANSYGEDIRQLLLAEGGEVWLPAVQTLRLADGWVDFGSNGAATRAAALHATATGQAPSGADLGSLLAQVQAGQGWVDLAGSLLAGPLAGLDDTDLVTTLYHAAFGHDPDAAELALDLGRLASGTSRAQMLADIAGSAAALAAHADPDGHWVAQALGGSAAWHMDTGGISAGLLPSASHPVGSAWML
ncbi:DUF4214 domain-containing protein [Belnapia sp. T6]|uniref:DUF4214 domain-containing protein n=1 Tax=Belnapia mucosa TaxID=2804532 RepID=A0ABS1V7H6_9PROT|nr:DUF4214 domain-containing protein [Belnapia mucosa]MBL6457327.1 DUF4214 domain-containing protein [Belnapia mucosa]